MPRVSNFEILKKAKQPAISVRATTSVDQLPKLIGESYGKMAAYLKETGEFLSDVPFVAYYNMDMQNLDVEIGFPVSKALPESGEIKPSFIPEGKVAFCMYRGAYNEMEPTYAELAEWIRENGLKPAGVSYEYYYNGPEFPQSEALTMIAMPVV